MKKINLFTILLPFFSFTQIENKIEGLTIDTPCALEYTRNLGNQNNYSCTSQDQEAKVYQYSVTTQNLFNEMNGLNSQSLKVFKDEFLITAKKNAVSNGENAKLIVLANGENAVITESYITYSDQKFINISIIFLYKKKSFIFNLTTNSLNNSSSKNLAERLKIK